MGICIVFRIPNFVAHLFFFTVFWRSEFVLLAKLRRYRLVGRGKRGDHKWSANAHRSRWIDSLCAIVGCDTAAWQYHFSNSLFKVVVVDIVAVGTVRNPCCFLLLLLLRAATEEVAVVGL